MAELNEAVAAAAFNRLLEHLRMRSDAQNVDLMGLAGFCRNCLADWIMEASEGTLTRDASREIVYGMPPSEWKVRYQIEATAEQKTRMNSSLEVNKQHREAEV